MPKNFALRVPLKTGFFNETLLISRNFPPTIVYACLFTAIGLSCESVQTLKNHDRTEPSLRDNVYNTKFSVETRLEYGFPIENTYLQ